MVMLGLFLGCVQFMYDTLLHYGLYYSEKLKMRTRNTNEEYDYKLK